MHIECIALVRLQRRNPIECDSLCVLTMAVADTYLGGLVEFVGSDEVDRQVNLNVVGLGLLHQFGDDLGALGVIQRAADLRQTWHARIVRYTIQHHTV